MSYNKSSPSLSSKSPSAIVMENSQYRRPASILSSASTSTVSVNRTNPHRNEDLSKPLPRSVIGSIFLSIHIGVSFIITFVAMAVVIFEIFSLSHNRIIGSIKEIPEVATFALAAFALIGLIISLKTPIWLLFGSYKTIRSYCFKDNLFLKYSSYLILLTGIISVSIHLGLSLNKSTRNLITPFLPAGVYLILNGLLNLKLHRELVDGGKTEQTIMLPYIPDHKEDPLYEEMNNV